MSDDEENTATAVTKQSSTTVVEDDKTTVVAEKETIEEKHIEFQYRNVFSIFTMIFSTCIIIYLIIKGVPENLLHQSALSWSFTLMSAVLAAYGVGSIIKFLPDLLGTKRKGDSDDH